MSRLLSYKQASKLMKDHIFSCSPNTSGIWPFQQCPLLDSHAAGLWPISWEQITFNPLTLNHMILHSFAKACHCCCCQFFSNLTASSMSFIHFTCHSEFNCISVMDVHLLTESSPDHSNPCYLCTFLQPAK